MMKNDSFFVSVQGALFQQHGGRTGIGVAGEPVSPQAARLAMVGALSFWGTNCFHLTCAFAHE